MRTSLKIQIKVCGVGIKLQRINSMSIGEESEGNSMKDLYYLYRIIEVIYNIKL